MHNHKEHKENVCKDGCCDSHDGKTSSSATMYTCPMHPSVEKKEPGRCSECGMNLVPKK